MEDKVFITNGKKFKKIVDISVSQKIGLVGGMISSEELRQITPGSFFTVKGEKYYVFPCSLHDYVYHKLKRSTQIIYPKELGFILIKLDISPGKRVGEAGTGSGALTSFLSRFVGSEGVVFSYERRADLLEAANKNVSSCSEFDNVIFKEKHIEESIEESDLDAFFLDIRNPWTALSTVKEALKPGGNLGVLLTTTNQVSLTLRALQRYNFFVSEVLETYLRNYKINPSRLRPEDRMIGHTGYLVFAKKVIEK